MNAAARIGLGLIFFLALAGESSVPFASGARGGAGGAPAMTFGERLRAMSPRRRLAILHKYGQHHVALLARREYNRELVLDPASYAFRVSHERTPAGRNERHTRDQGASGRCAVFAFSRTAGKGTLSESWITYHYLLEQAKWKLAAMAAAEDPTRIDLHLVQGGFFAYSAQITAKHGAVPRDVVPDFADAKSPSVMIAQIEERLAVAQRQLASLRAATRKRYKANAAELQDPLLAWTDALERRDSPINKTGKGLVVGAAVDDVTATLERSLLPEGKPARFEFEGKTYTPKEYAKDVIGFRPQDYIVLVNDPNLRINEGYRRPATVGQLPFNVYNVSKWDMKEATMAMIRHDEPVWFATKVGGENPYIVQGHDSMFPRLRGLMHIKAFDYGVAAPRTAAGKGLDEAVDAIDGDEADKALLRRVLRTSALAPSDLHDAGLARANHAMAFTGYDVERYQRPDGRVVERPTRFLVDNSHDHDINVRGNVREWDGHMHLYADFFNRYVTHVVVRKDLLPKEFRRRVLANRPIGDTQSRIYAPSEPGSIE